MINSSTSNVEVTNAIGAKDTQIKPVEQRRKEISQVAAPEEVKLLQKAPENPVEKSPMVSLKDEEKALQEAIKESVAEVIPKVRELMQKNQRSLDFKVAEEENRVIITVIDKETDKVIRQIPPEDVMQIAKEMGQGIDDALLGILVDSYA